MTERPTRQELEALIEDAKEGMLGADEAADVSLLADLLADPSTWVEPDAGLEDSVVAAVVGAEQTAGPSETPAVMHARRRAMSRRRQIVLSMAALAAAIVIVVGIVAVTRSGTPADFKARLSATGLAPGARASADITRNGAGFRVTLDARGLPPASPGAYYQAWLKNAAGTLVPIGTFSSSDGRVTLWSGVSPKDFPTITVTIESADNNQTSSGRRVLIGHVQPR
jgi:hypothetical protein